MFHSAQGKYPGVSLASAPRTWNPLGLGLRVGLDTLSRQPLATHRPPSQTGVAVFQTMFALGPGGVWPRRV
jgi:hypothetical protein